MFGVFETYQRRSRPAVLHCRAINIASIKNNPRLSVNGERPVDLSEVVGGGGGGGEWKQFKRKPIDSYWHIKLADQWRPYLLVCFSISMIIEPNCRGQFLSIGFTHTFSSARGATRVKCFALVNKHVSRDFINPLAKEARKKKKKRNN